MTIINANSVNFNEETKDGLVLVDFWATWCGPCKMISPILDEIASEMNGVVKIVKVDVDVNQDIAQSFGVMSIPTLLVIKNGNVVDKAVGFSPKNVMVDLINKHR